MATGMQAIPNQPLNFGIEVEECNNELQEEYCALYQMDDTIYYQWRRFPCNGTNKLLVTTGSELVVNGNFSVDPVASWTLETKGSSGWTWAGGAIHVENFGDETAATQDMTGLIEAKQTRPKFKVFNYERGTLTVMYVDTVIATITEDGEYEFDIGTTANDKILTFIADGDSKFSLDNVSVFETVSVSWAGTNWTFADGVFTHDVGFTDALTWSEPSILTTGTHYKMHIELEPRTAGTLSAYSTSGGIFTKLFDITDELTEYWFPLASGTALHLIPSMGYDGGVHIGSITVQAGPHFPPATGAITTSTVYIVDLDGNVILDLSTFIIYTGEYATFHASAEQLGLEPGCYRLCFTDTCSNTVYCSNCMNIADSHDCTKLITAHSSCDAFGFKFNIGFRLQQRLPVLKLSPIFPFKDVSDITSNGTHERNYAELGHGWEFIVDEVDETAHACLITQLLLRYFRIDGVYYFFDDREYKPDFDKEGRHNLAQVRFELRKLIDLIYNKNCGCT